MGLMLGRCRFKHQKQDRLHQVYPGKAQHGSRVLDTTKPFLPVRSQLRAEKRSANRTDQDKRNRPRHVASPNTFRRGISILLRKCHIDAEHCCGDEEQRKTR